jgi:hypothetical protein
MFWSLEIPFKTGFTVYANTYSTHFIPEDGGSIYLQNIGNTAHIHAVQRPKSRLNIKQNN